MLVEALGVAFFLRSDAAESILNLKTVRPVHSIRDDLL